MRSNPSGGSPYYSRASGGGSAPGETTARRPEIVLDAVDSTSSPAEPMLVADAVQRDDVLPISEIRFVDFGTGDGQEIWLSRNTGGLMRMRPTVGVGPSTPGDPKVLEENLDGVWYGADGPGDATAAPADMRMWVASGRKRLSIKLSDQIIQTAEERTNFNVTGLMAASEDVYAVAFDETNDALYTVTKQGGVYSEDVSTPATPVVVEEVSLVSYFTAGENLLDVYVHEGVGEEVLVVLSTHRLFTLDASTLAVLGVTEAIGVAGQHATFSALQLTLWDKFRVGKNATGDLVAYVQAQARGYELTPVSRPFGRVIVACDLDIGGGYAAPTFLPATPRVYNPFPTTPSGWAAYVGTNGTAKEDWSAWDMVLTASGGVDYLYVCHGKMKQVVRLTVTDVLGSGFTVGAIIPCHPDYSATPGSNTANRIINIAVHPSNYEKFILFEYTGSVRVVVLNAGLETVSTNNAHASLFINKGALRKVPVIRMTGPVMVAWHMDTYTSKHIRKGVGFNTASPVALFELYGQFAMDGLAPSVDAQTVYSLTWGGVIPYQRNTSSDPFFAADAGYQPAYGNDGVHVDRLCNTEQVDVAEDFPTPGDVSVFTCCGEGGFMYYTTNAGTKYPDPPVFVPQPAEYADVVGGPLDGWTSAAAASGKYYANNVYFREIDGEKYVLQDLTNRELGQYAVLAWRWSGTDWDFVTAAVYQTAYAAYAIPLSFTMHVTEDLVGRTFIFVGASSLGGGNSSAADANLVVVRADQLSDSDTMTVVEAHDLTGQYNKLGGITSSLGRLFLAVRSPATTPFTGQVVAYDFDTLTGVVDINNPVQVIDSSSFSVPTGGGWTQPWVLRFLQTDAGTGAGILCLGSSQGTYVEIDYDPENETKATATFTTTVKPNGYDASVFWRYNKQGETNSLATTPQTIAAQSSIVQVSGQAFDLETSETYEVRSYIYHMRGPFAGQVVQGDLQTFVTDGSAQALPPVATTVPATNVGSTTVTLNARVNPNGQDTEAYFQYVGPNGQMETAAVEVGNGFGDVDVSIGVTGLSEGSLYTFNAVATNHVGQVSYGNSVSFTTGVDLHAPQVVSLAFNPSGITQTTAVANVRYTTGGADCSVFVDYGTSSGAYTNSENANVLAGTGLINIGLIGLSASTTYYARAAITNSVGTHLGSEVTFTTGAVANAPSVLTALPDNIGLNSVKLHALVDPNSSTTTCTFEYWAEPTGGGDPVILTQVADATSASASQVDLSTTVLNLQPFTLYSARAQAANAGGTVIGKILKFRTAGLSTNLALALTTEPETLVTSTSAQLNGTLAPGGSSATYYFEFWVTGQNKETTRARFYDTLGASGPDPLLLVADAALNLSAGSTYNYRLCASSPSNAAVQYGTTETFTASGAPPVNPASVSMTSAQAVSASVISCAALVSTNGEDTEVSFEASTTSNFSAIAGTSLTQTLTDPETGLAVTGTITGLTASTAYYVRAKAVHSTGPVTTYAEWTGNPVSTLTLVAPTVVTEDPTNPTPTSMQFGGTVTVPTDVGAGPTYAWFEYGRVSQPGGTGYEVVSAEQNLGAINGTFQVSLTPNSLQPGTFYFCRVKARNLAGTTVGGETFLSTTSAPTASDPVPVATVSKNITPYSFQMEGTVRTNGSSTTVQFQYLRVGASGGWLGVNVVSRPAQVLTDKSVPWMVGDRSEFLGANPSATWQWRIKATNSTGNVMYAHPVDQVVCTDPVAPTAFPLRAVTNQALQNNSANYAFIDMESVRMRMYLRHNGVRTWMQMIYGTDPTLATHTKSRWVSYRGPTSGQLTSSLQLPNGPGQGQMRYADYMTGLTPGTQYYYQLVCWSNEGLHTGPIGSFTTPAPGVFSANWAASVGTQIPARNMMGPIPADLRTGSDTRSTTTELNWIDDSGSLDYSAAEDAYTILVTPTAIDCRFNAALDKTQTDSSSTPNLAYALKIARVGDKIRVDGSHKSIAGRFGLHPNGMVGTVGVGDVVEGATSAGAWTGKVVSIIYTADNPNTQSDERKSTFHIRILTGTAPTSLATITKGASPAFEDIRVVGSPGNYITGVKLYYSGTYCYSGFNLGGDANSNFQSNPGASYAYWGNSLRRYPVTGVRVMPLVSTEPYGLAGPMTMGNAQGGFNGVFFRGVKINPLCTESAWSWICVGQAGAGGGGVWGLKDFTFDACDAESYGNWGVKFHIRSQSPTTCDIRDGTFTPSNEHFNYQDTPTEVNATDSYFVRCNITGTSADGLKTYSQRSCMQFDARGDESQNSATGPGYAPGRATVHIIDCSGRSGTDAGAISIFGHFGTVSVSKFTHNQVTGPNTRQSLVTQEDTVKGAWFNEKGFVIGAVVWDDYRSNVANEQDSFLQARGVESLTIGTIQMNNPNNKPIVELYDNGTVDNGIVYMTGAGSGTNALYNWPSWPAQVTQPNRIRYRTVGITSFQIYQELQDGRQFTVIN